MAPALPLGGRAVAGLEPAAEVAAGLVEVGGRRHGLLARAQRLRGQIARRAVARPRAPRPARRARARSGAARRLARLEHAQPHGVAGARDLGRAHPQPPVARLAPRGRRRGQRVRQRAPLVLVARRRCCSSAPRLLGQLVALALPDPRGAARARCCAVPAPRAPAAPRRRRAPARARTPRPGGRGGRRAPRGRSARPRTPCSARRPEAGLAARSQALTGRGSATRRRRPTPARAPPAARPSAAPAPRYASAPHTRPTGEARVGQGVIAVRGPAAPARAPRAREGAGGSVVHRPRTRSRPLSAPEGSHSQASITRPSSVAGAESTIARDAVRRVGGHPGAAAASRVGERAATSWSRAARARGRSRRPRPGRRPPGRAGARGSVRSCGAGTTCAVPDEPPQQAVEHAPETTRRRPGAPATPCATAATRAR